MEHKRRGAPGGAEWATLSHQLMDIILAKIHGSHEYASQGLQAILNLRLVCKGWRDACSDYTGSAYIEYKERTGLLKLCKILPALSNLSIRNLVADTCFSVLSSMTSLRALSFWQTLLDEEPVLDPGHLPSSLKQLSTEYIAVDPLSDSISFTGLTSLTCKWPEGFAEGSLNLLKHLPALQELDFESGGLYVHNSPQEELGAVFRSASLTKLSLCFGLLTTPIHMPASASTLRHMHLSQMDFSAEWLHTMAPLLTSLTQLDLSQCDINSGDAEKLQAISSLRSMDMEASAAELLCLAGPDLQRLRYGDNALDAQHFATLRALTYLGLDNVHTCIPAGARPTPSSQLLEVSLKQSDCMTEALLLPGTLSVLRKVDLDERVPYRLDSYGYIVDEEEVISEARGSKTHELHSAVFSHPSLTEVSGKCRLFLLGIPDKWVRWDGSERGKLIGHIEPQHAYRGPASLTFLDYPRQVWRKIE